jgi:mevalonate kinase/hydroxymethylglutaryl-CoA synthase
MVDFRELIRTNEKLLEELGVVSPPTKLLVRRIEKIGGAAKISGAGGVKRGSGIVLAYHEEPESLLAFAKRGSLGISKIKLGEAGLKYEKAS